MTFTKRLGNFIGLFILYAMDILHPANVTLRPDRMLSAKRYKLLK